MGISFRRGMKTLHIGTNFIVVNFQRIKQSFDESLASKLHLNPQFPLTIPKTINPTETKKIRF